MKRNLRYNPIRNSSGLIIADFLFSFILVLGIGIFIFGITFSLATIEVAQYIVWSTARNYSAANTTKDEAQTQAQEKFQNLAEQFPLLTGVGMSSAWFELAPPLIDDKVADKESFISGSDATNSYRQPWTGASSRIKLKLFMGMQIPLLGKISDKPELFELPVRAFVLRHPSHEECRKFFNDSQFRSKGIKELENNTLATSPASTFPAIDDSNNFGEDNGC